MKSLITPIGVSLLIGAGVQVAEKSLKTTFFTDFLVAQLITIIITVLAINAATLSITLGSIRDLIDKYGGTFDTTRKACMVSISRANCNFDRVYFLSQVAYSSPVVNGIWEHAKIFCAVIFTACFFQTIWVLFDYSKIGFLVLDFGKSRRFGSQSKSICSFGGGADGSSASILPPPPHPAEDQEPASDHSRKVLCASVRRSVVESSTGDRSFPPAEAEESRAPVIPPAPARMFGCRPPSTSHRRP